MTRPTAHRRWRRPRTIVALALTGCASAQEPTAACPPSPYRSTPPLVIAHAGGEALGPSNTIIAMQRSVDAGADIVDIDLRMTSDGVIVARHDRDVATTTDGHGNVDELTWEQLRRLDAAATWSGADITDAVRIPSLDEVLRRFPDRRLSLELKQTDPSLADGLCRLLRSARSTDRVYLSANDDAALYAAQATCPEILVTRTYRDLDRMRAAPPHDPAWCAVSPIGQPPYGDGRLDAERVRTAHRRGMAVYTWTVDDPDVLRHLAEIGVDGVYTRRPDIARAVFDTTAE